MRPVTPTPITGLWSYLETIDWSESWFLGLLVFHLSVLLVTFVTMKRFTFQAIHFFTLLLIVYFAEQINEVAAKNYSLFARQQYFDSQGMFISLFLSGPVLLNCLLIVISWIVFSSQMMVATGKMKILREKQHREKTAKENQQKKSD